MTSRFPASSHFPASSEPLVRARFCQDWLTQIADEEEPYRSRFLARVTSPMRAEIEAASRVGWLPLSLHVALADLQLDVFGTARAHSYYRRSFVKAISGPFFAPLFITGARLLGLSPAMVVRRAPRGYAAGFKNAGEMIGEVLGVGRARLEFVNLPPVCTASDAWVTSSQGTAYGIYDILRVDGVVRLDTRGRAEGRMGLELEWTEPTSA